MRFLKLKKKWSIEDSFAPLHQPRRSITYTLKHLDPHSVLLVLDWAMKYLPRKYRESQTDWFGKRGISWHITTATRMYEGQLQLLSLVHLFESCYQDSNTVLAVIDDVLKQLTETMRKVNRVHLRQDNAGCYHSASTLLAIQQVAKGHDISIGLDFSDSQGKKGSCDRKAAAIKNHIWIYLNSGHDFETADRMKTVIESSGGVPGVRVLHENLEWDRWVFSIASASHLLTLHKLWPPYGQKGLQSLLILYKDLKVLSKFYHCF